MYLKSFVLLSMLFSSVTLASIIAVIDSGVDLQHPDLIDHAWVNVNEIPGNIRDEDRNGYEDDVHGWNFAENSSMIIDYSYLGTFSQDPYTFFAIQGRSFWGTATPEDAAWVQAKRQDEAFIKEMGIFGNFVHGTHVAGIAAKDSDAKILAVKLIPTEVKLPFGNKADGVSNARLKIVKKLLAVLAVQQMVMLEEIGFYISSHGATVANGSFGTGYNQAIMIVSKLMKKGTAEQKHEATIYFLDALIREGQKMMTAAPNTLYVFAAGNDGVNNDIYPTSPANIKADNSITVAATMDRLRIAVFSSYGMMVDVAAPGVTIESAIPGGEYLRVSGTSQAAPYVANVAGQIRDANPALTPKETKEIIIGTVDYKVYLQDKVASSGIVNPERAVYAAKASNGRSLASAITLANQNVADIPADVNKMAEISDWGLVLPLPSMFR